MVIQKKNIFTIFYGLFIFLLLNNNGYIFITAKVVIPFNIYSPNPESFIKNYEEIVCAEIKAGTYNSYPEGKTIFIFLNSRNSLFTIFPRNICPETSFYNKSDSLSYKSINKTAYDSFYFYTDIGVSQIKKFDEINFSYSENNIKNNIFCGEMGFNFITNIFNEEENIIYNLKKNNYINNYFISFNFNRKISFDNYEDLKGKVIIGELPHEYDKEKFFYEQYLEDNTYIRKDTEYISDRYQFKFEKTYVGLKNEIKTILETNNIVSFEISYGLISGPDIYQNYIEENFFNKEEIEKICKKEREYGNIMDYDIYICDNDIKNKFNLFPELSFYFLKFNYNFTFNYEDLFMFKNGKYYFKIIFVGGANYWRFGLPFFLKYQLVFNQDRKTIGFYNVNIQKNESNKNDNNYEEETNNSNNVFKSIWFWIIIIAIIVIIIIITVFISKYIYGASRRKLANELDDDGFDYETHKNEDNNNNEENNNKLFGNAAGKIN